MIGCPDAYLNVQSSQGEPLLLVGERLEVGRLNHAPIFKICKVALCQFSTLAFVVEPCALSLGLS